MESAGLLLGRRNTQAASIHPCLPAGRRTLKGRGFQAAEYKKRTQPSCSSGDRLLDGLY